MTVMMAGGGTGGHVVPALAVARELSKRGHRPVFVGTREGFEAKLVPKEGFAIEYIRIGGLNRVGWQAAARTLAQLPASVASSWSAIRRHRPSAMFSMGGYVAGPPMIAAAMARVPMVAMEPNAVPGMVTRRLAPFVRRALVGFAETASHFPGRAEITGLPVRDEFFAIPPKPRGDRLTILITGGSQGSKRINETVRAAWPLLREGTAPVRLIHQTGAVMHEEIAAAFATAGIEGEVVSFIADMPARFAEADLIVGRAGAGAVSELCAAGKPSILVPFPYAADDHQTKNAHALERVGAALTIADSDLTPARLCEAVRAAGERLESMSAAARALAKPGAASRAADVLEEVAR
ncbi:MAG: undecaprenyldiphospho-muramoylpentapeptide beta-N-acetylglucosaminyltransferase [Bryobacteraceae bacterium]|nr:undecaprenyldiphospho-muramoylpentapeptide beta-N-acetylglucosaminyltransferase [Bryobacteraceae bacterium]